MKNWKSSLLPILSLLALASCGDNASLQGQNAANDDVELATQDKHCGQDHQQFAQCSDGAFQLQLLHFADIDGGRDILNNAVRFSALLDSFRSQYANTLVLSSGDNWIPGPEYNVGGDDSLTPILGVAANGRAHVAYLNAMGVQATVVGNHELDLNTDEFAELIAPETRDSNVWQGAQFPYLSANLDFSTDEHLAPLIAENGLMNTDQVGQVAASTVILVNGEMIGVVGASTPALSSITKTGGMIVLPSDEDDIAGLAAEIQKHVDPLKKRGINKIILLAHMQQIAIEQQLAPLLDGVDIIVAGGSNTILADKNDRLRDGDAAEGDYPLVYQSASKEPVVVVNTDGDYTYLGRFVVTFDQHGVMLPSSLDSTINGAYATDKQSLTEHNLTLADAIPQVQTITNTLNQALQAKLGTVFGSTAVYLNGDRVSVRTQETNLGNLTADANLAYAQSIDKSVAISIKNGGGIRAPIGSCAVPAGSTDAKVVCSPPAGVQGINKSGDVTQLDMEIALRFNSALNNLTVTGSQLKGIIEYGVSATRDGATPGRFPQVAGMRFSFDPAKAVNSRVQNLVVLDDNGALPGGNTVTVVQNGQLDPSVAKQTFRLVTLDFLVDGGDGYKFPTDARANLVNLKAAGQKTGMVTITDDGTEQDALAEYLSSHYLKAGTVFDKKDLPAAQDTRIQNLSEVALDSVLKLK
ncbi:bifunctional metallophosphatase/5'-nucleotidase [Thalassotalea euphylliae]|uniref:Bifunctional metallophosphatase/5'-nucleotidase n=1 Tax=Thalassotalea euphylliae TaxID=1655234 RepID=A0A3E0UE90_9GAMM|nr:bifunctional metallophosphatase/5'-nucleotidase [Thalassotalea euphylliae]REL35199.1 bifunctional metallophosphatase/5'-nucleotidase [Thalassotalea euphylliae]